MNPRKSSKLFHSVIIAAGTFLLAAAAHADAPNFSEQIYGDGVAWGTKGTTGLPAPNEHNKQSFDGLFIFTNGVEGQLPVSEAAPGNPLYNGGRWDAQTVTWNCAPYLITDYVVLMMAEALGHVTITDGNPDEEKPDYFQCPLLPAKDA